MYVWFNLKIRALTTRTTLYMTLYFLTRYSSCTLNCNVLYATILFSPPFFPLEDLRKKKSLSTFLYCLDILIKPHWFIFIYTSTREKGITILRIYKYWILHHTVIEICIRMLKSSEHKKSCLLIVSTISLSLQENKRNESTEADTFFMQWLLILTIFIIP